MNSSRRSPKRTSPPAICRLYPDEYNAADVRQRRQELLDDLTDNAGLAFLGLTVGCAQCHNHKFDAILQTDYYRLQAFFTPMLPRDDLPDATAAEREKFAKQQAKWDAATADIRAQIEALVAPLRTKARDEALEKFNAEVVAAMHTPDDKRTALQKQICYQAAKYTASKEQSAADGLKGEQKKRYEALKIQLAKFDSLKPPPLPDKFAAWSMPATSRRRRFVLKGAISSGRPSKSSRAFQNFSEPRRPRSRPIRRPITRPAGEPH